MNRYLERVAKENNELFDGGVRIAVNSIRNRI